jgi:hypothetical protein
MIVYTDEEVIKRLEAYAETQCNKCAIRELRRFCGSCYINVIKQASALISRQKAEIERLQKALDEYEETSGLKQAKAEVAKEIFAEIKKVLKANFIDCAEDCNFTYYDLCLNYDLAKLKKKYIKGAALDGDKQ